MSIATEPVGATALAEGSPTPGGSGVKTPTKRAVVVLADGKAAPEPR